jgi:hypothetical protein
MDFGSMMFGSDGQTDESKKAAAELWKIYQQAYNVKPIPVKTATGIEYRYPQGAIQRFNLLLPMLQAQAKGTGKPTAGLLDNLLTTGVTGALKGIGTKNGGWEGLMSKAWDALKGGYDSLTGPSTPAPSVSGMPQQSSQGLDSLFSQGGQDLADMGYQAPAENAPVDNLPSSGGMEDWWSHAPIDNGLDLSNVDLSQLDWSGLY